MPEALLPLVLVAAAVAYGAATLRARTARPPGDPTAFAAGLAVVALAVVSPLDGAAERRLAWHMVQHVLLVSVAAPLLALGRPFAVARDALGRPGRARIASTPKAALAAVGSAGVLLVWHVPPLYDLALQRPAVHGAEHASLLASSAALWAIVAADRHSGAGVVWLYLATVPATLFGAALTFSRSPWYPAYRQGRTTADALRDQQLAGVVMWSAGGIAAAVGAVAVFATWLARSTGAAPNSAEPVP